MIWKVKWVIALFILSSVVAVSGCITISCVIKSARIYQRSQTFEIFIKGKPFYPIHLVKLIKRISYGEHFPI